MSGAVLLGGEEEYTRTDWGGGSAAFCLIIPVLCLLGLDFKNYSPTLELKLSY